MVVVIVAFMYANVNLLRFSLWIFFVFFLFFINVSLCVSRLFFFVCWFIFFKLSFLSLHIYYENNQEICLYFLLLFFKYHLIFYCCCLRKKKKRYMRKTDSSYRIGCVWEFWLLTIIIRWEENRDLIDLKRRQVKGSAHSKW